MTRALEDIVGSLGNRQVVVVGDVMLDEYLWGDAYRVSPEAPVPVVQLRGRSNSLGGAANAALNAAALGAPVRLAGVVGEDQQGAVLRSLLHERCIDDALVGVDARPTTTKTRILAGHHQVARVDQEIVTSIADHTADQLITAVEGALAETGGVLISDYAKGALPAPVAERVVSLARTAGVPVVADPKGANFARYRGATLITPNLMEAATALGYEAHASLDVERLGRELVSELEGTGVLITRGSEGMSLFRADEPAWHVRSAALKVSDVTGAGDTVAATLTLALVAGADLEEAAELANRAAGLVVQKVGTATVSPEELHADLRR